ncbi:MAG: stage II sporulation protein M [Candidatus Thorarchaeota archaeon]|nr:stage II sporulation protein M [Candidatus Thorarchaeota archaeon]
MAELNTLTVIIEFIPPIVVTLVYLIGLRHQRNRYIEAFLLLMYIKTVTFFLMLMARAALVVSGFNPQVDSSTLASVLLTDFVFQFMYALQELLTWVMVSFIAVLFGMFVLGVKMAFQDPLKMRFANLIRRITGKTPESDGFSGFRDRLSNLRFEGLPEHPLDPAVQSHVWRDSWRDYLIIGLATLLPSIPAYIGSYQDYVSGVTTASAYASGVFVLLTWMYRFGYPSSNRLAKAAGLRLGDRDVGGEMMRGVLGWFFRFNILLTLFFIGQDIHRAVFAPQSADALNKLVDYYVLGVTQAAPPILFAIIVLPLAEKFAVIMYKSLFEWLYGFKARMTQLHLRARAVSLAGSLTTGGVATLGFLGAIAGVTLFTAYSIGVGYVFRPGLITTDVEKLLETAATNAQLIVPLNFVMLVFSIPMAFMIFTGVVGHYVRSRTGGSVVSFGVVAAALVSIIPYFVFPNLDYILGPAVNEVVFEGTSFYRVRWLVYVATEDLLLSRYAFQFLVNVPIWLSSAIFVMYYLEYRKRWQVKCGVTLRPLLSVCAEDVRHVVTMFVVGLAVAAAGVICLSFLVAPVVLIHLIESLIAEIGLPDGLEAALAMPGVMPLLLMEHNLIRTLLMLVIGPVFWTLILWVVAVKQKTQSERTVALLGIVMIVYCGIIAIVLTMLYPNPFGPQPWVSPQAVLGYHALRVYSVLFGACLLVLLVRRVAGLNSGGWWFPPLATLFVTEYLVYDDQFTLIALIVLPFVLAPAMRVLERDKTHDDEDFLLTYIRVSLMSVAIAEVLSTALWVAGIGTLAFMYGNGLSYLASILPHGVIEIPAFLFAAAASLTIARELGPSVTREEWDAIPSKTRSLLTDARLWRTFILIAFFLFIGAMIEAYVTPLVSQMVEYGFL